MNIIGQNGNDGLHYDKGDTKHPTTDEIIAFNRTQNELKDKEDIYNEKEEIKKPKENNHRNTQHYG